MRRYNEAEGGINLLKMRLVELRKKRKLTQKELADKLGIARTTYSGYENGNREPDFDTVQKLADFFGVSIDYLVGRVNNQKEILSDKERRMYGAVGNMSIEELKSLFEFEEAEEEDIKEIIKEIEKIKIMRRHIKRSGI